jgi:NADH:ubiquinone oxidoreductase subunit 5 (subunit L)/multisubunit Na+/H+ antiporter MnhA subunit
LTLFISGLAAMVEEDVKKVTALRTLSQMGLSILTFGLGLYGLSFLHLVSHGFFKSLLFLQIGVIMHSGFRNQDPRNFRGLSTNNFFICLQLKISLFCLSGLFFSNGLVTKDLILELFFSNSFGVLVGFFFFISVLMTFFYSYRLWQSFFLFDSFVGFSSQNLVIFFISVLQLVFSLSFIWWLNLNFLLNPALFIWSEFLTPLIFVFLFLIFFKLFLAALNSFVTSKFLVDFFLLKRTFFFFNFKFIDSFLYYLNNNFFFSLVLFRKFFSFSFVRVFMLSFSLFFIFLFW